MGAALGEIPAAERGYDGAVGAGATVGRRGDDGEGRGCDGGEGGGVNRL